MLRGLVLLLTAALATSSIHSPPEQLPPEATQTTKFPWIQKFASIGDSYSAGLGAGNRLDFYCSRYAKSYPNILHTSLLGSNEHRTHQFLSCSGQTSTEILETQVPALHDDLDLLTISAGGNDIGLSPILSNCVYQFYMASEDACKTSIAEAAQRIASGELCKNITKLIKAAKPKMHPTHGVIYVTGYAGFFGIDDTACDNVTWAVWSRVESSKQYLKLELRAALNEMVRAVNTVLTSVVADAGPNVRFIDYNTYIEALRGRYCEAGVVEPAPNRPALAFYEWDTVDPGEDPKRLRNRTGEDVPKGSFEGDIAEWINKTLQEHPEWEFEEGKGFVNKTKAGEEVGGEGAVGDTIHWLLPDSWKRVFHLRPEGHEVVARLVVEDLGRKGPGKGGEVEVLEL
ncbi:SGNH hydrolase [Bimuria novae-zelandiae CBS 107.79]|uniref:SGNH hydrolase n=1 Tax=Bimuria novae-zelandiae CBS 107.79 TaxID=1447943 RepID=A0A6A5UP74_9PLEO|nr:SGNH hydrolase [Bimuria novae-zelandiae CBS 107.79]